jgi:hypothetical protein
MIRVKFIGGPMDGQVKEEDSPAEFIFPRGSSMDDIENFIDGKPITSSCYELDDKRSNYVWKKCARQNLGG